MDGGCFSETKLIITSSAVNVVYGSGTRLKFYLATFCKSPRFVFCTRLEESNLSANLVFSYKSRLFCHNFDADT